MRVVIIAGKAQHGKDTTAKLATEYLEQAGKKCVTIHYADYLKFVAKEYYNWNGEKDEKGRTLLQELGTEIARAKHPDIWVNVVVQFIKAFGSAYDYIFIPDFRYPNEHTKLVDSGYIPFKVLVTRVGFDNGMTEEQKNHLSEIALDGYSFDHHILAENMEELKETVLDLIKRIYNA